MSRWGLVLVPIACCVAMGQSLRSATRARAAETPRQPDHQTHPELRRLIGPAGAVVITEHFVVAYDTPIDTVRQFTARLESTYHNIEGFCRLNGINFLPPCAPLEILLFDTPEGLCRYADGLGIDARGLGGFYHPGDNRSAFFNILNHPSLDELNRGIQRLEREAAQARGDRPDEVRQAKKRERLKQLHFYRNRRDRIVKHLNRMVVQHEVAHHLLFEAGVHVKGAQNPVWLVEGLATMFEALPSVGGDGAATVNQMRLADFRAACGEKLLSAGKPPTGMKPQCLKHAYDSGRFVPLRRFITLHRFADDPNDSAVAYRYAQAWSLAFYLHRTHPAELACHTNLLARRSPGKQVTPKQEIVCFESAFGPVDEEFERKWAEFILELRFVPEFENRRPGLPAPQ
ncbi:MAG: DUF1570 domain-containing protein [Phycisphaerae bacterium]|nr:DUF1570 domain-containing protein [Phycisphaerae bacterium]